jgi:hypothetical protein
MIYLREMSKGKHGCPKFRLRWKGPYELTRRLSDLNYLVRIARNKEVIVNVSKTKKCFMRTVQQPHWIRVPQGEENQDVTEDEQVTSSPSQDHFGNDSSSPRTMTKERIEDQSQDPIWEPNIRQEIQVSTNGTSDIGREPGARFWYGTNRGNANRSEGRGG